MTKMCGVSLRAYWSTIVFKWLWNRLEKNMPLMSTEEDVPQAVRDTVTNVHPVNSTKVPDRLLVGIVEAALCEIAAYDDSIQLKLAWNDNSTQDGCYVAGFVYDYNPNGFIFDPVNGEQPLMAIGATPEEAMVELRKVLLPYFAPTGQ